jgi:polynucleotide 5'-kinase involved in rRNA processing
MKLNLSVPVPVVNSARVMQLGGLFDVPPAERSERTRVVDMPIGASGSGKSTLARALVPHLTTGTPTRTRSQRSQECLARQI